MFDELAIIIVNWNLAEETRACLDSLMKAGTNPGQIILVDNGSTDDSVNFLRSSYSNQMCMLETKKNLGYAAGANLGIRYALGQRYEWLLLLNNDTIVSENFVEDIHEAVRIGQEYSILTPVIFKYNHPSIIWFLGSRLVGKTLLTFNLYKNQKLDANLPTLLPIDLPNGCAMLIKRSIFEKIGLLDESLFMYGEEVDFGLRARAAGFAFACYVPAQIWHKISASSKNIRPSARQLQVRNQIIIYRRYSNQGETIFYFLYTIARLIAITILDLVKLRPELITASVRGWLDGWRRRQNRTV